MKAKAIILVFCAGLALRQPAAAQNQKEMTQALQRDVAALQDEVRKMKGSQDEKLSAIAEALRNTLDLVTRVNEKMAVMQTTMNDKVEQIRGTVGAPIQGLSSKVDSVTDQFQNLSNTVAELNVRMGKLDSKIEDVKKMIQALPVNTAPATAPPQQQAGGTPPAAPAPVVNGEKLFDDASRDYLANNTDLALQGFTEYVKNFPDAQRASDAQFYTGEIYVTKQDWENASKSYDVVINKYSDSSRVPMAHFRHATTLLHLGRRAEASKEFRLIIDKYPTSEAAKHAKEYLKTLGSPVSAAPAQKKRPR